MRIVLDTTILVAAVRSNKGAAKVLIDLVLAHKVTILMNYAIACEYRAVALRPNHVLASELSYAEIVNLIENLEDIAEPVEIVHSHRPLSPDPNDDLLLEVAIHGRANAIVTNNRKHFLGPAARFHIPVLDAPEALSKIR